MAGYKLGVVVRAAVVGTIALGSKAAAVLKGAGGASTLGKGVTALLAAGGVTAAAGGLGGAQQQEQQGVPAAASAAYDRLAAAQPAK